MHNEVSLNILVHDVMNLLYYDQKTDEQKYFFRNKEEQVTFDHKNLNQSFKDLKIKILEKMIPKPISC